MYKSTPPADTNAESGVRNMANNKQKQNFRNQQDSCPQNKEQNPMNNAQNKRNNNQSENKNNQQGAR